MCPWRSGDPALDDLTIGGQANEGRKKEEGEA
jgi:hypothetical protein